VTILYSKELIVLFDSALNNADTETQTFGCRHSNPEICGNNSIVNICAFCSDDHICKKPSRAWKKQYKLLQSNCKNSEIE